LPYLRHLFEAIAHSDTSELSIDVFRAGDQNHDGYSDRLVFARRDSTMNLYLGGVVMTSMPQLMLHNTGCAAVTDFNENGFKDSLF
jgi:hypothetical protein